MQPIQYSPFPAIYSTRDLALNAELFRVLVAINTGGALLWLCINQSILVYPKQLIRTQWLWAIPIFFSGWWLLDTLFLLPEPSMGAIYLLPCKCWAQFYVWFGNGGQTDMIHGQKWHCAGLPYGFWSVAAHLYFWFRVPAT